MRSLELGILESLECIQMGLSFSLPSHHLTVSLPTHDSSYSRVGMPQREAGRPAR